jgi:hypothetical protein
MTIDSFAHRGSPGRSAHFLRHLLEMTVAMMVGMLVGGAVFVTALGTTAEDALRRYPVPFVLVMAFSMTLPMVAWMRHRGHGWRSRLEMGAAMLVPAIALVCLKLAGVISGTICGAYCIATLVAMVALMLYRRDEYSAVSAIGPQSASGGKRLRRRAS